MQSHKSFAAYTAYKRMFGSMELVEVNGQKKVLYSYEYRERNLLLLTLIGKKHSRQHIMSSKGSSR